MRSHAVHAIEARPFCQQYVGFARGRACPLFTMKLYHFTCGDYLSSILKTGLDEGEIMLNLEERVLGISLSEDPDSSPRFQSWVAFVPEKLQYRLTIELEPCNRLVRWKYVPDVIRLDRGLWKKLKGDPYKWWVYFGTIKPQSIIEIFDTSRNSILNPDEIEQVKKLELIRGKYVQKFKWVLFEDALVLRQGSSPTTRP
jgi:hypothetical protein